MTKIRMAVVGVGEFGRHHARVIAQSPRAELVGVADPNLERAQQVAATYGCQAWTSATEFAGKVDAAVVAVPTTLHAEVACPLLEAGVDVLVEKPIAGDMPSARRLIHAAQQRGRILQVGHLERFNPAVTGLKNLITLPLFFEIHRLSLFSPRSLDVDVVLDLMIHDLDIVLSLIGRMPEEIRAAGISILSQKVDIANVRLAFSGGVIANLTASRVSTDKVRKLRIFQPSQYISVDYARQDGVIITVSEERELSLEQVPAEKDEPLRLEVESFLDCVTSRNTPVVNGEAGANALEVALSILDKIEEHAQLVAQSLAAHRKR
jgi:predicted dehydrogenase